MNEVIPPTAEEEKLNKQRAQWRKEYQRRKEYYVKRREKLGTGYWKEYRQRNKSKLAEYARKKRAEQGSQPRVRNKPKPKPMTKEEIKAHKLANLKTKFLAWKNANKAQTLPPTPTAPQNPVKATQ